MIIRVIEPLYNKENYVSFEKLGDTVQYLNTYLESSKRMDLRTYKSIIRRKLHIDIPDDCSDSMRGFASSENHETFYSEVTTWYDETGDETEVIGKILYRNI